MLLCAIDISIHVKQTLFLGLPESNGYIYVEANGGLNQQRTSVCIIASILRLSTQVLLYVTLIGGVCSKKSES